MKYKQAIIIRKDLKLGAGKIASQAAHAAVGSLKNVNSEIVDTWDSQGAKKVVLKVSDLKELLSIHKKIKDKKIPCFVVKDAGLTQLKAGTVTALGIGPEEEKKLDRITGKLKLF